MNAEEYLERIEKIDSLIINKWEDYCKWNSIASGAGGSGGDSGSSSSRKIDKMQNAIVKYMGIDTEIEKLKEERKGIIRNIEKLPVLEYKIIYAFYVSRLTVKEIVHREKLSCECVKKHKKKGLRMIQNMITVPQNTSKYPQIPLNTP
jgi:DNA-directed RNA polymerase specialized sigma subunit